MKDVLKDVFLPWFNAYRYLTQSIERLKRVICFYSISCIILLSLEIIKTCRFLNHAATLRKKLEDCGTTVCSVDI